MKKIVFSMVFMILIIILTEQNVSGEEIEGEEERKIAAEKASDALKRNNTRSEPEIITEPEKIEEKEVKKKLGKLKKLLPTEEELDEITLGTVWRYLDKQSQKNEEENIEVIQGVVRDIGRVYDPVVNKFKIATIQIEIIKFENFNNLKNYWFNEKNSSLANLYDNAYLVGKPNEHTECLFNYSNNGAITICKTDEFVIQSIIFDKYQEHYMYSKPQTGFKKLELNQDEMTTRIVEKILEKIQKNVEVTSNGNLYKILESNREIKEREYNKELDEQNKFLVEKNKELGIEKDKKYGIQKFSCLKDEFGLIMISGQYNNNQIKKDKVVMEILFLDYDNEVIFKNKANLLEINKFETKRFLGNLKIDENFSTCTIQIKN
ncbi:hypothetical protein OAH42_00190 [Nitrosopumilus sp.]|nr:hypothetical protein [Nitrosopumilus sp.]MDB4849905.1 hypothetical protein [Nitrosopumilus sp.]